MEREDKSPARCYLRNKHVGRVQVFKESIVSTYQSTPRGGNTLSKGCRLTDISYIEVFIKKDLNH